MNTSEQRVDHRLALLSLRIEQIHCHLQDLNSTTQDARTARRWLQHVLCEQRMLEELRALARPPQNARLH